MKNLKLQSLTLLLALGLAGTACDGFLDNSEPVDLLINEVAILTTSDAEATLVGAYNRISDFNAYGYGYTMNAELLTGTVRATGRGNLVFEDLQLLNASMSQINGRASGMWQKSYEVINSANNVIDAIQTIQDEDIEAERGRLRGEALFLRAITHWELVRLYGSPTTGTGVPYITEPGRSADVFPARETIDANYASIIADLEEADQLLLAAGVSDVGRGTHWAAKAYLAKVYFQRGQNAQAITYVDQIIAGGAFALNANYADAFSPNEDDETIFRMTSTGTDNVAGGLNERFNPNVARGGVFGPSDSYVAILTESAGDSRADLLFEDNGGIFYAKYDQTQFSPQVMNLPIVRYAEILLMKAEIDNDVDAINDVRNRAGLGPLGAVTADAVFAERQKELAFEGDYFHNLKRLQLPINGIAWNDNRMTFPIPFVELEANDNLSQNPGYAGR